MIKEKIKKFWNFLWYSNSLLSWILLFALAFIIVKFVFFPLLGFLFHSEMPFVIVESYSMQHCNSIKGNILWHCNFDEYWLNYGGWYIENGISKEIFSSFDFKNGLDAGDIVAVKGKKSYEVGDIIVFFADHKPIIHRIVNKSCENNECIYTTKGDNNFGQLDFERIINEKQIIGKASFVLPKLGWIKLLPFKLLGLA